MNDDRIENTYRGKKLDYFYALPNEFTYSESQEIADDENVKLRTAQKWIYDFRYMIYDLFLLQSICEHT